MATPPTTRPETWVPAGAEGANTAKTAPSTGTRTSGRKPTAALPPPRERKRARRSLRERLSSVTWMALEAAIPWAWFLVRDLGSPMQLVALFLPAVIAAAILGLVVAWFDGRKLTTVAVLASVVAFGWAAVLGPASAQPSPAPTDPVRVATVSLPGAGGNVAATLAAISGMHADIAIVIDPSKKARANLVRAHSRDVFQLGSFVVLSSFPVRELALPRSLAHAPILRLQVDRPKDPFVVYAVGAVGSVLDTATNDPLRLGALEKAARAERLPVVLMGDFGMSDRSTGYGDLTGSSAFGFRDALRAGGRAGGTLRSFPWSALLLRVDYVLTSRSWCAANGRTFDIAGSAQAGVTASVGPCPA